MSRVHVTLPDEDVKWFYEKFGEGASLSWWLGLLLNQSRDVMTVSIRDIARNAAQNVKEELK